MSTEASFDAELRRTNVAVIHRYLDAWSVLDVDAIMAALHPDVELEFGYAAPGVPDLVVGRVSALEFLRAVPSVVAPMNFVARKISTLEDPAELFADYRGNSRVLATDKPYRNRYMSRARVEDGLIRRYAEFSDPLTFMEAFTLMTDTTLTAEDRIEIHELLARRGYASDTADVAGWVATFTSDGVLEQPPVELDLPGGASKMPSTVEGTDALTAFLEDSLPNIKGLRHLITNTTTDPTTGGGAIARSAFHVLDVIRSVTVVTGRYTDTLKRTDEGWKTVHLNVDVDG